MGGCRCAYKNCTLRTDGVTHMFHFPVFDKVRCHQWLTNAEKLEFLNLKVSQLKNRVICQHHFKDDNFMNFKKDKLTFDAVPTEDGPFCDSSQLQDKIITQDDSKLYSIALEDIENDEYLTFSDKKANFSVKYGDFLTNCDIMDLDSLTLTNPIPQSIKKDNYDFEERTEHILNESVASNIVHPEFMRNLDKVIPKNNNTFTIQMTEVPIEVDKHKTCLAMPIVNPVPELRQRKESNISVLNKANNLAKKKSDKDMVRPRKITILNEQKISEPVPIPENLELVNPSLVLPLPNKRRNSTINTTNSNNKHNASSNLAAPNVLGTALPKIEIDQAFGVETDTSKLKVNKNAEKLHSSINNSGPANTRLDTNNGVVPAVNHPKVKDTVTNKVSNIKKTNSLLKNKMPPEKKAAIEEKRKFNIKLRDIITSCLDKLDDGEDPTKDVAANSPSQIEKTIKQKVTSYLAKEPELPSVPDYTVAYLEARMKKMENNLINKIDKNTQRIVEIKQLIMPTPRKKAVHTQTLHNKELEKKHLYNEISKYLSPEANSLLYEELFINQHVPKITPGSPTKRRKYR